MKHLVIATALALSLGAHAVSAAGTNKPAYDKSDDVVTNTFGNCVRTKWDANTDVCAPPAPPPPPVVVAPPPPPPPPAPRIEREARTVYFDFNKSSLNAEGVEKLDALVGRIKKSKRIIGAGIAGFADRIGSDDYNLELSKKRAKTVYDYLSERVAINTQILDIRALGENGSVTNCDAKLKRKKAISCLQEDRRVEVVFQYQE